MAGRYNLRSQQDRGADDASYASLPGTSSSSIVANMTSLKSNFVLNGETAGSHPSRWIYEITHKNMTLEALNRAALAASTADVPFTWKGHAHRLVINGNQTFSSTSIRVLSTVCVDCLFHFVFTTGWDEQDPKSLCSGEQATWPLPDDKFPGHHLVWADSIHAELPLGPGSKYFPLLSTDCFACCAPRCTFQVTVSISRPRITSSWVDLLSDHEAIREQLRIQKERDPERYQGVSEDWVTQAPMNLNTYLKNLLESTFDTVRSISKRNRRFAVLFGPRCSSIFHDLEFSDLHDIDDDGVDIGTWTPHYPGLPSGLYGTTELCTYRAYLEDVRSEIQCLIHKTGLAASERPTFCNVILHSHLHCQEVSGASSNTLSDSPAYQSLGVMPSQGRAIIVNAYKRQWELAPGQRRNLVESLGAVAHLSGDEMLSDYAAIQSSLFDSQLSNQSHDDDGVISQVLKFLDLAHPNNYNGDQIVEAFRRKVVSDPASASTGRSLLMLLAAAASDDSYQAALLMESDKQMSLGTAQAVLGLHDTWTPDEAFDALQIKLNACDSSDAKDTYFDALEALTNHHFHLPQLRRRALQLRESPNKENDYDDNSRAVTVKKPDVSVNFSLPVGLENIGNTCYLNSLLQYLFTVKPIRDIVLHYDHWRLDLSDESIKSRLLGGHKMQMDRGEAVVAQAFVRELCILFENLEASDQAATRPSQRLANAVLLSTHTLMQSLKQPSGDSATAQPPPLPARKPSEDHPDEGIDMESGDWNANQNTDDTTSISSAKTLVDPDDKLYGDPADKAAEIEATQGAELTTPRIEIQQSEDIEMTDSIAAPETTKNDVSGDANDVSMADVGGGETIDQKVLNALEQQQRSSGTDQQDVEEVMGSIINRLQAAIKPMYVDTNGVQLEPIMGTFFVSTVNYTKKFDEKAFKSEMSFERSITAFPAAKGPCSLYDALGRNFDKQILEDNKLSRYTAIRGLPPILHVMIQRSQSMGDKNDNPVVIPETLYLDRYMDAPHDSQQFRRRVQDWAIADRIADIKALQAKLEDNAEYIETLEDFCASFEELEEEIGQRQASLATFSEAQIAAQQEKWNFDGEISEETAETLLAVDSAWKLCSLMEQRNRPAHPLHMREARNKLQRLMAGELQHREESLKKHHDGMTEMAYRLHAVICHRGHMTSGHYWVWICDFDKSVWRWYNDSEVRENKDTAEVLENLSTSGEPYYLCYVRDKDKEKHVGVPKRKIREEQTTVTETQDDNANTMDIEQPSADEEDARGRKQSPKYRIE
ncbi:hypothetical protein CDD81_3684 [Ophiocordyceps australis]|uniref:ubiquitinyl hydrolase 1 n=1 Tax=Ophiocordyceps australis TaxID=1399860 RepID=A0A2C5XUT4_9HYPO|nr:hypothetical protein CDD81_3684 [Ophiocordyceps australis]